MPKRIIIIGAGEAGQMIVREIRSHTRTGLDVVGFLDDDASLHGQEVEGYRVLGGSADLPDVVRRHPVDEAIISVPSGSREFVRRIVALCRDAGISFKIVPGLIEIIQGPVHLDQIREVHPEDLLGRETVEFDESAIGKELEGRRVLVTGAGGSIGGEICRQLARFKLGGLCLLGRGENQIFQIEEELRNKHESLEITPLISDVRDRDSLEHAFERHRPEFVYHAAAHKHVHYMESHPQEAVKNNIFGTANVIETCRSAGVDRLVMISTDKAVKPLGVMGATKRIAEYLMVAGSQREGSPRLITVRFGNVLGSRGSVVPLFIRQIRAGGPLTISNPDATRFFMTLKEACMLVVQASMMGHGGEVFILQMGSPIRIMEIAKDLIALHGLRPGDDIEIREMGLREGEKLHEDLVGEEETVEESSHGFILTTQPRLPDGWNEEQMLSELRKLSSRGDDAAIRSFLGSVIPDSSLSK